MTDVLPKLRKVLTEGPFKEKILSLPTTPFYLKWLSILDMTSATRHSPTHTKVSFRFPVQSEYLNPSGKLHGAAQCLFFDVCTTFCLGPIARAPDFWTTFGVTRSLHVNYLRPAREGEVLLLECETVDVGKRLGLLKGFLKRERDGAVVSTCEHTVYNVDADAAKL